MERKGKKELGSDEISILREFRIWGLCEMGDRSENVFNNEWRKL